MFCVIVKGVLSYPLPCHHVYTVSESLKPWDEDGNIVSGHEKQEFVAVITKDENRIPTTAGCHVVSRIGKYVVRDIDLLPLQGLEWQNDLVQ